jgi:hypothetical protein
MKLVDEQQIQQFADLLAADLDIPDWNYTVSLVPSPSFKRAADLRARGLRYTHDPDDLLPNLSSDEFEIRDFIARPDDPRLLPYYVRRTSDRALAIRLEGDLVAWIEFDPDGTDGLFESLGQAQTSVQESGCNDWPRCPVGGHPHPLDLIEQDGRIAWCCPSDRRFIAWFGEVWAAKA